MDKTVLVIGCGGLGCNVLVHLAGIGINNLIFMDDDVVSQENLNRQFLYGSKDLGRPKAECAERFLHAYAPDLHLTARIRRFEGPDDLYDLPKPDAVVLAVDNVRTRKAVQDYCAASGAPLVNGGVDGYYGTAYLYIPGSTPCLRCAGLSEAESDGPRSVSSTVGVIGSLCAELAVRALTDRHDGIAGWLHVYDNCTISKLKIKSMSDCLICGKGVG